MGARWGVKWGDRPEYRAVCEETLITPRCEALSAIVFWSAGALVFPTAQRGLPWGTVGVMKVGTAQGCFAAPKGQIVIPDRSFAPDE